MKKVLFVIIKHCIIVLGYRTIHVQFYANNYGIHIQIVN